VKQVNAALGNLNAAHASATARANASANSMVGKIAEYEKTMREKIAAATVLTDEKEDPSAKPMAVTKEDLTKTAIEQLGAISNKEVTPEVVAAVNAILGLDTSAVPDAVETPDEGEEPAEAP